MTDTNDDFFASLDAEIALHTQKKQIRKDAASAKKIAMNRAVTEVARLAALREWRELQALIDVDLWKPIGYVGMFTEQVCDGCGSVHRMFLQHMEQQQSRTRASDKRFVRVPKPEGNLPRSAVVRLHRTHICPDCCDDHGYFLDDAIVATGNLPIAISPTYEQGDINAQDEANRSADTESSLYPGELAK